MSIHPLVAEWAGKGEIPCMPRLWPLGTAEAESQFSSSSYMSHHGLRPESPFQRLPTEVMQAIFIMACPLVWINKGPFAPSDPEPPWKLELVCTQWASVATTYQTLWSTIHIGRRFACSSAFVGQIELALDRSSSHTLSIIMTVEEMTDVRELIRLLGPHSSRIRFISLRIGNNPLLLTEMNDLFARGNPCLCDFAIVDSGIVTIVNRHFKLPWKQITNLTLLAIHATRQELLWSLRVFAPQLVVLKIRKCVLADWRDDDKAILLPTLCELCIFDCYGMFLPPAIEGLSCPSLKSFGVHHSGYWSGTPTSIATPVLHFFLRSSCIITSLGLRNISDDDILPLLSQLPLLERLALVLDRYSVSQLMVLKIDPEQVVCPALQVLHLTYLYNVDLEAMINPIQRMLASRSPLLTSSTTISLDVEEATEPLDAFTPLRAFELSINTWPREVFDSRPWNRIWGDTLLGSLRSFCTTNRIRHMVRHHFVKEYDINGPDDWYPI